MNTEQRYALVLLLMQSLRQKGSWCGETHIQKNMYMLEELKNVSTEMNFILYKHGPYSFELHDIIGDMQILGFVVQQSMYPYGPQMHVTEKGKKFLGANAPMEFQSQIDFVSETFKDERVQGLERLATALFLLRKFPEASSRDRAGKLHEIKPHIPLEDALDATSRMEELAR